MREEADFLLDFAVEGARRLVRQRDFTIPSSSRELLNRWMLTADPVRAWAAVEEPLPVREERQAVAAG